MNSVLENFNDQQKQAITFNGDSTLVVAGAGSGKTMVLTYRVVYLIKEIGIDPKRILGFTFTNKAANEMKERITKLIPNVNFPYIGTFHGICLRILREDIVKLNLAKIKSNFSIIDADDQLDLIKELYNLNNIDKTDLSYKNCLNYISSLKTYNVEIDEVEEELLNLIEYDYTNKKRHIVKVVYEKYISYLENNNMLDFDDLIKYTLRILSTSKEALEKWQNRFDYILVDEFQDTNNSQFEIIKFLSKEKNNVFAVGDPDQMIYSWRGAYDDIFKEYLDTFKNVKTIVLEKNYRSTKKILSTANKLIKNNSNRIEKNLYTDSQFEGDVVYYNAPNQDTESKYVATKIKKLILDGYKYKDIAILYRSNYLSRNIEQQLTYSSIPYHIYGGLKFYQRKEIKDILAFLRLISNGDEISLLRIYNVPKRGISEKSFLKIKEFALSKNISTFEAFNEVNDIDLSEKTKNACKSFYQMIMEMKAKNYPSILAILDDVLEKTEYIKMLTEIDEEFRNENIQELKSAIFQFEEKKKDATLDEYLQEITLVTSIDEETKSDRNFISLMTIHTSKGLEFKVVFIIEFNEGIFPSQKAIDEYGVEEERRIAYVAITRAKEHLYILSSEGMGFFESKRANKIPSRFFDELRNEHLTVVEGSVSPQKKIVDHKNFVYDVNLENLKNNYEDNYHNENKEYEIGDWIIHTTFGEGVVIDLDNFSVKIAFKRKEIGTKTILKNHKSITKRLS